MGETELISRCIRKDVAAWDEFVKRYSDLISGSAYNRLKKYGFSLPRHEIDDIRQNTFSSIWEGNKLRTVQNQGDLSYWLAIVAGNEAINYVRKNHKENHLKSISALEEMDEEELAGVIPSPKPLVPEALTKNEISNKIKKAISSLPPRERLIIKLNLLDGKKYHEIADILRLPRGTVSSYIRRGKEKLKKKLKYILIIFATISALFTSIYTGGGIYG